MSNKKPILVEDLLESRREALLWYASLLYEDYTNPDLTPNWEYLAEILAQDEISLTREGRPAARQLLTVMHQAWDEVCKVIDRDNDPIDTQIHMERKDELLENANYVVVARVLFKHILKELG